MTPQQSQSPSCAWCDPDVLEMLLIGLHPAPKLSAAHHLMGSRARPDRAPQAAPPRLQAGTPRTILIGRRRKGLTAMLADLFAAYSRMDVPQLSRPSSQEK